MRFYIGCIRLFFRRYRGLQQILKNYQWWRTQKKLCQNAIFTNFREKMLFWDIHDKHTVVGLNIVLSIDNLLFWSLLSIENLYHGSNDSISVANMFELLLMAKCITSKKCIDRDKCDFATIQGMFGVLAIYEILCYQGLPIPESRTLSHSTCKYADKFETLWSFC